MTTEKDAILPKDVSYNKPEIIYGQMWHDDGKRRNFYLKTSHVTNLKSYMHKCGMTTEKDATFT